MQKKILAAIAALFALAMLSSHSVTCAAQDEYDGNPIEMEPIVSTEWLRGHLSEVVVLDVRSPDAYAEGHIPGAVNVPEAEWYVNHPFTVPVTTPWMELPASRNLFKLIGGAGITESSSVVVVGSTSGPLLPVPLAFYAVAGTTRVAITLRYAGVKNVAVLDGGYEKWVADGYEVESDIVTPTSAEYRGHVDRRMRASLGRVKRSISRALIIDVRDEIVYNGTVTEPWCKYPGHIPSAVNLPTPGLWIVTWDNGNVKYITYNMTAIDEWEEAIGEQEEIIVYCGVGGYASTAYLVISDVLGYDNVRFYDGSAQQWTFRDNAVEP